MTVVFCVVGMFIAAAVAYMTHLGLGQINDQTVFGWMHSRDYSNETKLIYIIQTYG